MNDLPTSADPVHGWPAAYVLPIVTALVLLVRRSNRGKSIRVAFLGVCAAIAVANYVDYGRMRYGTYLNEWDVYHYYLGSKYFCELSYGHFYEGVLAADHAIDPNAIPSQMPVRDLKDYTMGTASQILAREGEIRARFTPERWQSFVTDTAWFRSRLPLARWQRSYCDHGHNAPPTWTAPVSLLTNALPITDLRARWALILADPVLLGFATASVAWAFGWEAAFLSIILVGTHYLLSWGHLKGSLLRTDFAVGTVMSVCFLKKGRPFTAGVLLGWAACARVFPILFAAGPVASYLSRQEHRASTRAFLAGVALCGALGVLFALVVSGPGAMVDWARKILLHDRMSSIWHIGLRPLTETEFILGEPHLMSATELMEEPGLQRLNAMTSGLVSLLLVVPACVFMAFARPRRSLPAGFVLVFCLAPLAYYYMLILIVPLLFFLERRLSVSHMAGAAWMFVSGALGYLFFMGNTRLGLSPHHQEFPTYYYMGWCIFLTALTMLLLMGRLALQTQRPHKPTV
jgi:hypothetical protein